MIDWNFLKPSDVRKERLYAAGALGTGLIVLLLLILVAVPWAIHIWQFTTEFWF